MLPHMQQAPSTLGSHKGVCDLVWRRVGRSSDGSPGFFHPVFHLVFICLATGLPLDFLAIFLHSFFLLPPSASVHASSFLLPRCLSWNPRFRLSQLHRSPRSFIPTCLIHYFFYNSLFCGNLDLQRNVCEMNRFALGFLYNRNLLRVFKIAQFCKNWIHSSDLQSLLCKTEICVVWAIPFLPFSIIRNYLRMLLLQA